MYIVTYRMTGRLTWPRGYHRIQFISIDSKLFARKKYIFFFRVEEYRITTVCPIILPSGLVLLSVMFLFFGPCPCPCGWWVCIDRTKLDIWLQN